MAMYTQQNLVVLGNLYILRSIMVMNLPGIERWKLKVGMAEMLLENSSPKLPGRLIGRTIAPGAIYLGSSPGPAVLVVNKKFGGVKHDNKF